MKVLKRSCSPNWKNKSKTDNFLPTLSKIFKLSKWFGIPTNGNKISYIWAAIIFLILLAIELTSIWRVITSLTGISKHGCDGHRSYKIVLTSVIKNSVRSSAGIKNLISESQFRLCGVTARLSGAIFYANGLLSQILSWRLMTSWKKLSHHWTLVETTSLHLPSDRKIGGRVMFVACFVAICASSEHMLSMMSATGFTIPAENFFERYMLNSHGFLFHKESYSLWKVVPTFVMSKMATILWNFQDLIIILISMGLTSRYLRLNMYVNRVVLAQQRKRGPKDDTDMFLTIQIWRKLREAYVRQSALVRTVSADLGPLVLLSNVNNLYFICLQLFLGLHRGERGLVNKLYYFLSLSWLLFRACSVMLAAAEVNLHSKRALLYLSQCPEYAYNIEIKRLKHQLTYDKVALSGMGFFSLDRKKILEVAGNILKYELVLIQYDRGN